MATIQCPTCTAVVSAKARFCPRCGRPLALAETNHVARPAAVSTARQNVAPTANARRPAVGTKPRPRRLFFPVLGVLVAAAGFALLWHPITIDEFDSRGSLPLYAGPAAIVLGLLGYFAARPVRATTAKRLALLSILAGVGHAEVVRQVWSAAEYSLTTWCAAVNADNVPAANRYLAADADLRTLLDMRWWRVGQLVRYSAWPAAIYREDGHWVCDLHASVGTRDVWHRFDVQTRFEDGQYKIAKFSPDQVSLPKPWPRG